MFTFTGLQIFDPCAQIKVDNFDYSHAKKKTKENKLMKSKSLKCFMFHQRFRWLCTHVENVLFKQSV